MATHIVWFKNDLRLADNPALHVACASGAKVALLYILDERAGAASRWWLYYSLAALRQDIAARGGTLILRRGDPVSIIPALAKTLGADEVHTARSIEPYWRQADKTLDTALKTQSVRLLRHHSVSLFPPEAIRTKAGGAYGVFTPFSKACFEAGVPDLLLPAPARLHGADAPSEALEDWDLLPAKPDWAGGLRAEWKPGEAGAAVRLHDFCANAINSYGQARDYPGRPGTSKLSPHIHFGEISPRTVWLRAAALPASAGVQTYLKELLWREFSLHLLWQHPDIRTRPIREEFRAFPWAADAPALRAWQRGQTGIPIVDAGMRELWQTGWMHNRVRMIVASYLVKHLLIPWRQGEAWFWDCLCEADEAANGASWQWVAGCGADAAPYFRIFNPVLQGQKFDTDGAYVRRFVPELARLTDKYIHAPWEADAATLARAGIHLGQTYPAPLVELAAGRARALEAYAKVKAM